MGWKFSKKTGQSSPAIGITSNLLYTAEQSPSDSACHLGPDLQTFDVALHGLTNRVIDTHAVELRSLSSDSLRQVTNSLLETNQEDATIILECMKDKWKNPQLFNLVKQFVDKSLHKSDFSMTLEKCLKWARDIQLFIQTELQHFEAEGSGSTDGGENYLRILEELKNFKSAGCPFTKEFVQNFHSIFHQQISMHEILLLRKSEIKKKLESRKRWVKVSCIISASAFVVLLIGTVVAAAVAAPPVAAALGAATSVPLGSMIQWFNSLWKDSHVALKGQKEIINSMLMGNSAAVKDMHSIWELIHPLKIQIEPLLQNADFSPRHKEAAGFRMEEIKKLGVSTKSLEDFGNHINCCIGNIRMRSKEIVQKMINHPK